MQSAFAVFGVFPPPTAGADILAWSDGACTGLASYAGKPFVVQFVVWHGVFLYIIPHLFFCPIDERIEFYQSVEGVGFYHLHVVSGDGLLSSQSANPYLQSFESAFQRFEFAVLAAQMSFLYAFVEEVHAAVFRHHFFDVFGFWEIYFQFNAVFHIRAVYQAVCFREKPSGVECENFGVFFSKALELATK